MTVFNMSSSCTAAKIIGIYPTDVTSEFVDEFLGLNTVYPGLSSSCCHDKTDAKSVQLAAFVDSSPKYLNNIEFTGRANFGFEVPSLISTGDNFPKFQVCLTCSSKKETELPEHYQMFVLTAKLLPELHEMYFSYLMFI